MRVFVGRRTASTYTSDFSWPTLSRLVPEAVGDGARHERGRGGRACPTRCSRRRTSSSASSTRRRSSSRRPSGSSGRGAPRRRRSTRPRDRQLAGRVAGARARARCVLANTPASWAATGRRRCRSRSCRRPSGTARWSATTGTRRAAASRDLESPKQVGRNAAERTLRRLGARQVTTAEVPVVFDPETRRARSSGTLFARDLGLRGLPQRDVPEGPARPAGRVAAGHARGRRPARCAASARAPSTARACRRGATCRSSRACCATGCATPTPARKIGAKPTGTARRGVGGRALGAAPRTCTSSRAPRARGDPRLARARALRHRPDRLRRERGDRRLLAGRRGHWIENGRLTHPVHEVTIAGNLSEMLQDVDAVGNDLVFRGATASPTLRIRR